ncbi:MAG: hypothetical protein U0872_12290 [Planctomycetaceae bacterium]
MSHLVFTETYEPGYLWLLTVRKTPNPTTPGQGHGECRHRRVP